MRRKLLATLLSLVMIFTLVTPVTVMADTITADTSWYDAGESEFTLTTAEELMGFSSLLASNTFYQKTVKLGDDITLNSGTASAWLNSAPDNTWVGGSFAGTFDGQGHTVSGVYMNTTAQYAGFFTTVTTLVKDVTFANSCFKFTDNYSGALAGYVNGTGRISGVTLASDVVVSLGGAYNGGLVGYLTDTATVTDCTVAATVTGTKASQGGIVGRFLNGTPTVANCTFSGSINSTGAQVGGIAGDSGNSAAPQVTNCTVSGTVSGSADDVGGIIGATCSASVVEISDCTVSGTVSGPGGTANKRVGGVAASNQSTGRLTISNCRVHGTVTDGFPVGGILGRAMSTTAAVLNDCVFAGTLGGYSMKGGMIGQLSSTNTAELHNCISLLAATANINTSNMKGYFFGNPNNATITIDNCTIVGEAIAGVNPSGSTSFTMKDANDTTTNGKTANAVANFRAWNISTATQLMNFRYIMDYYGFDGNTATLTADIDLNEGWTANAGGGSGTVANDWSGAQGFPFNGTFDGGSHTISGLYINNDGIDNTGFLKQGYTNAIVRNVTFANSYIRGRDFCGVVFGNVNAAAAVSNVTVVNDVYLSARNYTGGLIGFGFNAAPAISGCSVAASISCQAYSGGLVGRVRHNAAFTVSDSSFSGSIAGAGYRIGGLIGDLTNTAAATFSNCSVTGSVSTSGTGTDGQYVGGALAYMESTCSATVNGGAYSGSVSGVNYIGGVIGAAVGTASVTGVSCAVNVTGSGLDAGGVVGSVQKDVSISNVDCTATVSSDQLVGGIAGAVRGAYTLTVSNTRFGGSVSSTRNDATYVGGIVGSLVNSTSQLSATDVLMDGTVSQINSGNVGGVVGGSNGSGGVISLNRVLVTGTVSATGGNIGALIGRSESLTSGTLEGCYALDTSASNGRWQGNISNSAIDTTNTVATLLTQDQLAGVKARTNAAGLFGEGDAQWTSVAGDFPVLASFSNAEEITAVYYADISSYRTGTYTAPVAPAGTVFAGWFTDEELTVALGEGETSGAAYAKFVDAGVLSVRSQQADGKIRIVTTVDSLELTSVGFVISYDPGTGIKELDKASTSVYQVLTGWINPSTSTNYTPGGLLDDGTTRAFSRESTHFMCLKLTSNKAETINANGGVDVTPYWVTLDGTRVTGTARSGLTFGA